MVAIPSQGESLTVPCPLAVRTPGWSKVVDATGAIGPFAHKGDQWYSYEDPASVTRKANHILSSGYGGAMVWDLSFDDALNDCCREPMPLLRAINRVLRSVPYPPPRPGGDCTRPSVDTTPPTPTRTTTYASGEYRPQGRRSGVTLVSHTHRTTRPPRQNHAHRCHAPTITVLRFL